MAEHVPQPPIPTPVIVCDLVQVTPAGFRRNRFYFSPTVNPTGITQLEAVANRCLTVLTADIKLLCTTVVKFARAECQFKGTGGEEFEANSTIAGVPGALAATIPGALGEEATDTDTLPDDVVLIIQKRTGSKGRGKRGRWFFSGLSEQIQNDGLLTQDGPGLAKAAADNFSADIAVTGAFTTTLHARHWDRKDSLLLPITKCYAIATLGSRMERRRPHRLERV